jgi:hypothetical protein
MEHICKKILLRLAKRNYPNSYGWWKSYPYSPEPGIQPQKLMIRCLICDKDIETELEKVEKHGLNHLKESNLLPFI